MIFKDYYKILGLESNKVNIDEIKIAYREKAKKYHPDINMNNDTSEEIFKDINEAYRTLSNEKLKRKYDYNWNKYIGKRKSNSKKPEKKTFKEILIDILFGGISKNKEKTENIPIYGENVNTEISISIKEAFFGVNKKLKFRTVDGKETSFNFKIPAGIQNHDKIRIAGQGKPGKNGGKSGDLLVIINIKDDEKLKLIGNDLYTKIDLKTWEAVLGTEKKIQILGETLNIIVPKCTNSDENIIIKDKGYKNLNGKRGNLHIITKIVVPKEPTKEEEETYKKLKILEQ